MTTDDEFIDDCKMPVRSSMKRMRRRRVVLSSSSRQDDEY